MLSRILMAKFKPQVKSYKHQKDFVTWLWRKTNVPGIGSSGGAAFFDPGTGKTKTAYDFISAGFKFRGVRRVLVLCPINAMGVWDDQADKHILEQIPFRIIVPQGKIVEKTFEVNNCSRTARDDELTILILNYAAVIKRDKKWAIMSALQTYAADVVVLDESHHIKNATAKQSKAAHKICEKARFVLPLTGTPIGKNYLDLYSQLKAIDPDIWKAGWTKTGRMSWTDFRNNYGIYGGRTGYELKGYRELHDLKARYNPHIRTARKESIHDMPEVIDTIVPVDMSASARRVYDVFAEHGVVVHKQRMIEAPIPLTKLLRLQQMTGGWVNDEHGETVEVQRDKMALLSDLLSDLYSSGQSVIVFARFLRELEEISANHPYKWFRSIQGGVSSQHRKAWVDEFSRGEIPRLMAIQISAAEALDGLQDNCSYGIFYSVDYSLIHWNQARGRLDRVGQTRPVTFYHLQARGTVDSLILDALRDKKNIEKIVMENPEVLLAH